jgi:hypothetical protein
MQMSAYRGIYAKTDGKDTTQIVLRQGTPNIAGVSQLTESPEAECHGDVSNPVQLRPRALFNSGRAMSIRMIAHKARTSPPIKT